MNPARDVIGMTDGNLMEKRRHRAMRSKEEIRKRLELLTEKRQKVETIDMAMMIGSAQYELEWVLNDKGEK